MKGVGPLSVELAAQAVLSENPYPDVLVMQSGKDWNGDNGASRAFTQLNSMSASGLPSDIDAMARCFRRMTQSGHSLWTAPLRLRGWRCLD